VQTVNKGVQEFKNSLGLKRAAEAYWAWGIDLD